MSTGRTKGGQFAKGNPGGPGRPPRQTERRYMSILGDCLTPEVWTEICRRAVEDAKAGDKSARDWLAKYALGSTPISLTDLAADEAAGFDEGTDLAQLGKSRASRRLLGQVCDIVNSGAARTGDKNDDDDDWD